MIAPTPEIKLPHDVRSTAFRELVSTLQANKTLRRIDILWRLPDDKDFDNDPPKGRIFVRLDPKMGDMKPVVMMGHGARSFEVPFDLQYEMRVPSFIWDDTPNLWGAICRAIFPGYPANGTLNADLLAAGICWIQPVKAPDTFGPDIIVKATHRAMCYTSG